MLHYQLDDTGEMCLFIDHVPVQHVPLDAFGWSEGKASTAMSRMMAASLILSTTALYRFKSVTAASCWLESPVAMDLV